MEEEEEEDEEDEDEEESAGFKERQQRSAPERLGVRLSPGALQHRVELKYR